MSACPQCQSAVSLADRIPLIWQQVIECPRCTTELHTAEHHCVVNMIGLGTLIGMLGAGPLQLSLGASLVLALAGGQLGQAFAGPLAESDPRGPGSRPR